jgi:hypothetical protein
MNIGSVLRWICGIVLILFSAYHFLRFLILMIIGGDSVIEANGLLGNLIVMFLQLLVLVAGLLFLPPTNKFIRKKLGFKIPVAKKVEKSENASKFFEGLGRVIKKHPFLVIFFSLIAIGAIISSINDTDSSTTSREPNYLDACTMSQIFVERNLKAPSTAEYPETCSEMKIYRIVDENGTNTNICTVTSYVDAQNSFGAMIRSKYYVRMQYTGDDKWIPLEVVIS